MATVVGITAAKAQAIEDASVVSGAINVSNGHLILTTANGTTIDAGQVVPVGGVSTAVGLTEVQTLSNKTLLVPVIVDFTQAQHDHGDANDGGKLVLGSLPDSSSGRTWELQGLTLRTATDGNGELIMGQLSASGLASAIRTYLVTLNVKTFLTTDGTPVKGNVKLIGSPANAVGTTAGTSFHEWIIKTDDTIFGPGRSYSAIFKDIVAGTALSFSGSLTKVGGGSGNIQNSIIGGLSVVQIA